MEAVENGLERLVACVEEYDKAMEKVTARRKLGDGILGFGNDPKRAPCHMDFYENMGEAVTAALAEGADAEAMVRFLLELAQSKGHYQMAYPMLEAVQGHALVLVPHLEPQRPASWPTGMDGSIPGYAACRYSRSSIRPWRNAAVKESKENRSPRLGEPFFS